MKKSILNFKTMIALLIAISSINTNAQGFLKKLAAALEPKPINGVWDFGTAADGKWAYAQAGTQFTQFNHPKENTDKKLEIEYTGVTFGRFERFTCYSIPKIYLERETQPNWYMFQTADSTFFIVNRMENYKFDHTKNLIGIITSNKDLCKELLKWNKKETPTSELIKTHLKEVQNLCDKIVKDIKDKEANQKAKAEEEAAKWKLPKPAPFSPSGVTQKIIEDAINAWRRKNNMPMEADKYKYAYSYFTSPYQMYIYDDWKIIKEKKLVNGTYDDVITKRMVHILVIYQTSENIKNNTYTVATSAIWEDAAFGVYDGSKWTGKYYVEAMGTYKAGVPAANMMEYKNSVK